MSWLIARLEYYKLIRHPLTIIFIALAIGLLWLFFYRLLVDYLTLMQNALLQGSRHASLSLEVIKPFFSWSIIVLCFVLPLLTTYAFSTEISQKTFYLWATHQVTAMELVLGKFLCLLGITLLILITMLFMLGLLQYEVALDWGMIMGGCFATLGISAAVISFGLFISSLLSIPLLAMGITLICNVLWLLIEWLIPLNHATFHTQDFSLLGHSFHLLHGHFQTQDIAFYLLFTFFWLTLCVRSIRHKMRQMPL